ncbi:hypothetical protein RJ640_016645 [Escallonia rubra]|uniref:HMA domain-containing protein n=1 Tax=Escallonia rubra TaxID=112253 RepID=A0AA88QHR0_9ASTE|nr:hypothetical protein RJ640_016645 [Escallonia rubra]
MSAGVDSFDIDMDKQKVTVTGYVDQRRVLKVVRRTGRKAEFWPYPYDSEYYPYAAQYLDESTFTTSYNYYMHGYNESMHGYFPNNPAYSTIIDDQVADFFNEENVHACSIIMEDWKSVQYNFIKNGYQVHFETVSLPDPHIMDVLTLDIKTQRYNMRPQTQNLVLIYRIYYKAMTTICPAFKQIADPDKSVILFQSNPDKTNVMLPRRIKFNELTPPEDRIEFIKGENNSLPDFLTMENDSSKDQFTSVWQRFATTWQYPLQF